MANLLLQEIHRKTNIKVGPLKMEIELVKGEEIADLLNRSYAAPHNVIDKARKLINVKN